jgi:hypothetical protein
MLTGAVAACCAQSAPGTDKAPNEATDNATQIETRSRICRIMPQAYSGIRFQSASTIASRFLILLGQSILQTPFSSPEKYYLEHILAP